MIAYVIYSGHQRIEFSFEPETNNVRIQYNDEDYFRMDRDAL